MIVTPRQPGHATPEGQRWLEQVKRAQSAVEAAERRRDDVVRQALERGLGIRGVAKALGIDKMTAQRRYGREGRS
jgi:hypothetical protein